MKSKRSIVVCSLLYFCERILLNKQSFFVLGKEYLHVSKGLRLKENASRYRYINSINNNSVDDYIYELDEDQRHFNNDDDNTNTTCVVPDHDLIGDGNCDGDLYNTTACDYDGGDCLDSNNYVSNKEAEVITNTTYNTTFF